MTGEEHLEKAALELKQYMEENKCGFCRRKAEGISRAIVGLKEVTGEAQALAMKIESNPALKTIDQSKPIEREMPTPTPAVSPEVPIHRPEIPIHRPIETPRPAPKISPEKIAEIKKRLAQKEQDEKAKKEQQGLGILGNRPRIRDVLYFG